MVTNNKRRNNKNLFPQNRGQVKTEVKHNPQLHNYINWSWQHKILSYKYKIIDNPMCPCTKGHQTVQHIIFDCPLLEKEREKLKAVVTRTENWPVSCNKLRTHYYKNFKEYMDKISWNIE